MSVSRDPRIGTELVGYRIEALLGRGGMSVVYRAEHLRLRRKVALKLLAPELAEDERFRERFLRESELAASIDHPHIVPIYDAGEAEGQLFIAMRYVEGTDLKTLLREQAPLAAEHVLVVCTQIADALDAAHEFGLVHRDVKPGNVLLDRRQHVYLADFGLTKQVSSQSGFTVTGQIAGTIDYVAPEAIEGKAVDGRADQYSLGCVLFECLAGRPPFRRDSEFAVLWAHVHEPPPKLSSQRPELGAAFDRVIAKALAKAPAGRFETCRQLVNAAQAALPEPARVSQPPRRRVRLLLAAAVAAIVAILAVALPVVLTGSSDGSKPTIAIENDAIQRIDADTNELVATIEVPVGPFALAVGGGSVWAANAEENEVFRIEPASNEVAQTIQGSGNPERLSFGADVLWALNSVDGIVTQIDPTSGRVARTFALPSGTFSSYGTLRASDDGVWVSWVSEGTNAVRIEPRSTAATAVQIGSASVAQTGDFALVGPRMLWTLDPGGALLRVDPRSSDLSEPRVVPLGGEIVGLLAADRTGIWLTDFAGDRVLHVDADTRRIDSRVPVGDTPYGIAVGEGAVWVANYGSGTLSRIDPAAGKVVATIPVGPNPTLVVAGLGAVWVDVHAR